MPHLCNMTCALIEGRRRIASWGLWGIVIWGGVMGWCYEAKRIYRPGSSPAFCSCCFPSICIQQNALFLWNTPCPKLWPSFITLLIHSPLGQDWGSLQFLGVVLTQILMFGAGCGLVTQLGPALCNLMDCSPPGSSVHGISQARLLEWVGISLSRKSSRSRDWTWISCIAGGFFINWATREDLFGDL